ARLLLLPKQAGRSKAETGVRGSLPRRAGEGWGGGRQVAAVVTTRAFGARPHPSLPPVKGAMPRRREKEQKSSTVWSLAPSPQAGEGTPKAQRRQALGSLAAGGRRNTQSAASPGSWLPPPQGG